MALETRLTDGVFPDRQGRAKDRLAGVRWVNTKHGSVEAWEEEEVFASFRT